MFNIHSLRSLPPSIISIGSHKPILQSMLDFDFINKRKVPGVKAIIASGRKYERYFFGNKEILIPVFESIDKMPDKIRNEINLIYNTTSARRVKNTTIEAFVKLPSALGAVIFAEDVPEVHALEIYQSTIQFSKFALGPASVGLLIPGTFKLGAIGGTDYRQYIKSSFFNKGSTAILSASGGMVNELINIVTMFNKDISFALSFGGDRFPIISPVEAILAAQNDPLTKTIIYYGELGGKDELEIARLLSSKKLTKKIICYIAGVVSDLFETPPQFGHAKAMAKNQAESALEKRRALAVAGAIVPSTFSEFTQLINNIPANNKNNGQEYLPDKAEVFKSRKKALITSTISDDINGDATLLNESIVNFINKRSFASVACSMFLGKNKVSKELEQFADLVLRMLADHGPYVSGAVNTIVTARAGRDMVSALSAGLLTIGPRFGGAVNQAAANWLKGITQKIPPEEFVEYFASQKIYIQGIGHKKYRTDLPDPRVSTLIKYVSNLRNKRFTSYALEVQKITTAKKGNLILNVDGAIAAILLDILSEKENFSDDKLHELVENEFFNAFFILSRTVGLIAHFLDQKRLDEGLFRLPVDLVTKLETDKY